MFSALEFTTTFRKGGDVIYQWAWQFKFIAEHAAVIQHDPGKSSERYQFLRAEVRTGREGLGGHERQFR